MEQVFSVYAIDSYPCANSRHIRSHGRALKLLKLGQKVYFEHDLKIPALIIEIVSYGHSFDELEPMMGCSVTIELDVRSQLPENIEWLYG